VASSLRIFEYFNVPKHSSKARIFRPFYERDDYNRRVDDFDVDRGIDNGTKNRKRNFFDNFRGHSEPASQDDKKRDFRL
jgi:hypothetical protein